MKKTKFKGGAVRGKEKFDRFPHRFDLIDPAAERRIAETYGEGAAKYGYCNYKKGIPATNLLNHAMDHINRYRLGDNQEDHLAHACWNLITIMYNEAHNPNMIDINFSLKK